MLFEFSTKMITLCAVGIALLGMQACSTPAPAVAGEARQQALIDFKSCAKPIWPPAALAALHSGTVSLGFLVSADGKVLDSKIDNSSGHPDLDEAARAGIALCKFVPASMDGKPVQGWARVQYVWTHALPKS